LHSVNAEHEEEAQVDVLGQALHEPSAKYCDAPHSQVVDVASVLVEPTGHATHSPPDR
tara:strand:- start:481 stop:654 length:174 start_codon:yes stop_codon:yes gene_type:complete